MGYRRKASSIKVSESRARSHYEGYPLHEPCPTCGKLRYFTRKAAKAARHRTNRSDHISIYRCGDYFHIGHTPWQIRTSLQARSNTLGDFKPDWRTVTKEASS